ncbi:hypothetical protein [Chryseobacterium culicis]|uniref:Uncharacterized protein n=1 Tax=Chryseobacterium culicis TaxID=680127 RepID=A0A1H6ILK8_CHRCI|nr:hypothetical protein [Chryseobacterium culicis]SEH49527.1 hypothetical protein SAMN05421593_0136 [Chryseobacterium culicis]
MIKSKIHRNWYLWLALMLFFLAIGFYMFIVKTIVYIIKEGISFSNILVLILCLLFELFIIIVIKDFKYIIIDGQKNQLKYYSFLQPFGRILSLNDFDNKIKTSETSMRGEYEVVYLLKKGYTVFKISGLFYDNLKEMDSSIKLKRIYNYKFNLKLYLQLLFTGKIRIEEER